MNQPILILSGLVLFVSQIVFAADVTLTVKTIGTGRIIATDTSGRVLIDCVGTLKECSQTMATGTKLRLQAEPTDTIRKFSGWSAGQGSATACTNTTGTCSFTILVDSRVHAGFGIQFTVTKTGNGKGIVHCRHEGGILAVNCNQDQISCTNIFQDNTRLTCDVVLIDQLPSVFRGWLGCKGDTAICNGTKTPCTFTLNQPSKLQAELSAATP